MGEPHVDPAAAERDALGIQQRSLTLALGQRAVGAHDPVPRDVGVLAIVQDRPCDPRRAG